MKPFKITYSSNLVQNYWRSIPPIKKVVGGNIGNPLPIASKIGNTRNSNKPKDIVYNNFPFPDAAPGTAEVQAVETAAQRLLEVRAGLLAMGKTLADLYDPNKILAELLALHQQLDAALDACYGVRKGFESEARRVGWLFEKLLVTN